MKEFIEMLKQKGDSKILLSSDSYDSSLDNVVFEPISLLENVNNSVLDETTSIWIDGGNSEIFGSPAYSLQMIKVAAVVWKGKKSICSKIESCFVFCDSALKFSSDSKFLNDVISKYNVDFKKIKFYLGETVTTSVVAVEKLRRITELEFARQLSMAHKGAIVVLDGSLIASNSIEIKILDEFKDLDVLLCAVSKSSGLSTDRRSLGQEIALLPKAKEHKLWVAKNILVSKIVNHNADIYFCKLAVNSKLILRVDVSKSMVKSNSDLMKNNWVFQILSFLSNDPIFIGYPYPLVKVDSLARVSNEDVMFYKTRLMISAKEHGLELEKEDLAKCSHDILDSIRF
jgi:hypothetical protein